MLDRLVLLAALLSALASHARTLDAVVTHVSDGDTLWVRPAGAISGLQVRLQGLDAPEICQEFGSQARAALAGRLLRRQVRVDIRARDAYQRAVGRVTWQGQDVGAWLVAGGYAWSAHSQGRPGVYAREEMAAREARRGLWQAAAPLAPRAFRKRHGSCRA